MVFAARTLPSPKIPDRGWPDAKRADIQGLRAVAVTAVVLFHAGVGVSGGFVGVDAFFVVSGFVICGMLSRQIERHGRIRFGAFYLRRARRLLPALAVVSLVTLAATALLASPLAGTQEATGTAGATASVSVANAYFLSSGYFNPISEGNPFLHTWSLSVEEQFYLVFPLLLVLVVFLRRRFSMHIAVTVLVAVLAVSFGAGLCFTYGWLPEVSVLATFVRNPQLARNFAFFTPLARGWEFLAGALLAILVARRRPSRGVASLSGAFGAALLCVAVFRLTEAQPFPGWLALVPVLGTVLLLIAGSGDPETRLNAVPRLLRTRWLVWLGDISYSWYLWHWPVIVLARNMFPDVRGIGLIAALLSLAPAVASYRLVERPIHRGHRIASSRATAVLVASCLAIPVASGYGLTTAARHGWGQERITAVQAVVRPLHLDATAGCANFAPLGSRLRPPCRWTTPGATGTVLLIGDSNAGQLTEPVIAAARSNRLDVEVATPGGCPFVLLKAYFSEPCESFVGGSLESIVSRSRAYDAVVIANSLAYVSGPLAPTLAAAAPGGGGLQQRATAGWAEGVDRTLQRVSARSPVILIGAVPQYKAFPGCLAPTVFAGPAPGCGEMSPATSSRQRDGVVAGDLRAVAKVSGRYVDTAKRLCAPTVGCSTTYRGALVYRDGSHLNVTGSLIFEDDLRAALTSVRNTAGRRS